MAYSNPGNCRFFVNVVDWMKSTGYPITDMSGNIHTDNYFSSSFSGQFVGLSGVSVNIADKVLTNKSFIAILGHNFYENNTAIDALFDNSRLDFTNDIKVNDCVYTSNTPYNGFSIVSFNGIDVTTIYTYWTNGSETSNADFSTIIIGTYYDMPHSPELSLSMSVELDGVKRVRTRGGNDLVSHQYTKPPLWGSLAPWELSGGSTALQKLSRSGRRTWDLSFNQLAGSDLFGANQSIESFGYGTEDSSVYGDDFANGAFVYDIITDDNFFSQVINRTGGGQLPFIFQPDKNDNNNFAICKFDMKSFQFSQIANGVYNTKLKIREVW